MLGVLKFIHTRTHSNRCPQLQTFPQAYYIVLLINKLKEKRLLSSRHLPLVPALSLPVHPHWPISNSHAETRPHHHLQPPGRTSQHNLRPSTTKSHLLPPPLISKFLQKVLPSKEHCNRMIKLHHSKDAALFNTILNNGGWLVPTHEIFGIMLIYAEIKKKRTVVENPCKGSPKYLLLSWQILQTLSLSRRKFCNFQDLWTAVYSCRRTDFVNRASKNPLDKVAEEDTRRLDYLMMHVQAL